ncbi:MAG TPA: XRE family transcriptional regulator [Lachnospiraceae bacterium]|nr:XRE family transcriptional regulator [Lachnospiraceae bacterium]
MEINEVIGANLKWLREKKKLSLGQLSELSGISKVMLSQIEKGTGNPTINTIWKIANGLQVSYSSLLEQHEQTVEIIKKKDIAVQDDEGYRIYCYYPTTPNRTFEMYQIEMEPGCCHESIGHSEISQEYIMVADGALTMDISGSEYELRKDDAIVFDASGKHIYYNRANKKNRLFLIIYYTA